MWSLSMSIFDSWWRWSIGDVFVVPKAVRSPLFCTICNLLCCVCERCDAKAVQLYSMEGL